MADRRCAGQCECDQPHHQRGTGRQRGIYADVGGRPGHRRARLWARLRHSPLRRVHNRRAGAGDGKAHDERVRRGGLAGQSAGVPGHDDAAGRRARRGYGTGCTGEARGQRTDGGKRADRGFGRARSGGFVPARRQRAAAGREERIALYHPARARCRKRGSLPSRRLAPRPAR